MTNDHSEPKPINCGWGYSNHFGMNPNHFTHLTWVSNLVFSLCPPSTQLSKFKILLTSLFPTYLPPFGLVLMLLKTTIMSHVHCHHLPPPLLSMLLWVRRWWERITCSSSLFSSSWSCVHVIENNDNELCICRCHPNLVLMLLNTIIMST